MKRLVLIVVLLLLGACSACRLPAVSETYKGVTKGQASAARERTVKITGVSPEGMWFATGWFIANNGTDSVVATAGHVCEDDAIYSLKDSEGLPHFALNLWDDDPRDLCLLYVPYSGEQPVFKVSSRGMDDIEFGERIWYTGFPDRYPALIEGLVTGRRGSYLVGSMQTYFGASGSAVLDSKNEVVGVISAVDPNFTEISIYAANVQLLSSMAEGYLKYGVDDYGSEEGF